MQAILLVAGRGSRLKELTSGRPKPFVYLTVNQRPLIEHMLDHLNNLGVTEAIVVVGYLKEYFYEHLGNKYKNIHLQYVEVKDWETTNNAHGLSVAKKYITGSFLIVEGDEFFLDPFISKERLFDECNYWIGIQRPVTGCLLFTNEDKKIKDLDIVREESKLEQLGKFYKSCGIIKISSKYSELFFDGLENFLERNIENKKKYFDIYVKENIKELPIYIYEIDNNSVWGEVDSQEDLNELHSTLSNFYSLQKIDKEKRKEYWKSFYLHNEKDDILYHAAGADKDISTSGFTLGPSVYLHYFYRFNFERKLLQYLITHYKKDNRRALDVGCGTGRNSLTLAQYFEKVDSFDLSEKFIEENKKRFVRYLNISFFSLDVLNIHTLSGKYDLIFLGGICMYLSDDEMEHVLKTVSTLLSPEGIIVVRDTLSKDQSSFYSQIKVYRNESEYEAVFKRSNLKLKKKFNGPNRNIWCSLFYRIPRKLQDLKVVRWMFQIFILGTLLIDIANIVHRPFKRNKFSNQLFYIFEK